MEIPEGVNGNKKDQVCMLQKGLVGLKQSGIIWYKTVKEELQRTGVTELYSESCMFIHQTPKKDYLIFCLYVDNILIPTTTKKKN